MDFFAAQAQARKRTHRLVLLFILAVLGTVVAGYAAAVFFLNQAPDHGALIWWDPLLLAWTAGATTVVVGIASLYKWSQLRAGGAAVAELVGGRLVSGHTTDLKERRLLNVVEEMAIASGIPMPVVYVLENEAGLNAFAAGLTTSDAAVAVTRGLLDKLSRDELQGVIGHEFSHILNGDMRLNVRITAIVFGILVIGLIGRGILQSVGQSRGRSSSDDKKGGGVMAFIAVGLALFIIGYIGYFFGRLIQAAVSRQREFLADASAVQFTRNPDGISGALKKIGGYALEGNIADQHAPEIGHFFFAQAFKTSLSGLWATHPPLDERIRAVEVHWDGALFSPPITVDIAHESSATAGFGGSPLSRSQTAKPPTSLPFKPVAIVADIGALTEAHFRQAQTLLAAIPSSLREATRKADTAQLLVYGLLLSENQATRNQQQALVKKQAGPDAAKELASLDTDLRILAPEARLPLLQLALPHLRELKNIALERFTTTIDELVHADNGVSHFEYALQKMLQRQLALATNPRPQLQFDSFDAVRHEIAIILSALAHLSPKNTSVAFADGAAQIPVLRSQLTLLDSDASGLMQLDPALDKLAVSAWPIKQRVLVAAGHVIASDSTITREEGELYRAIAATLDCPMPMLGLAS
ncbi:MAG: M48 family metallopeptidase [Opitutaceae bacterium]